MTIYICVCMCVCVKKFYAMNVITGIVVGNRFKKRPWNVVEKEHVQPIESYSERGKKKKKKVM